ncbi:MAG TPA: VOC family protein [Caulobacteraceae bacterium]|jgi:catechol 2,3-dioxygenase-like lactoylglutathione lyase family enzyme|nr:VOC family protein [Caulobacteraceae bacterium]
MLSAIDHVQIAIPVGGEYAARPFYCDLLGLRETPKPADMAARGGAWFEHGDVHVHLGVEKDFRPNVKAHVAFRVSDVVGLVSRAKAEGFQASDEPLLDGYDQRAFIYDPFGNRLEFLRVAA